MDFRRLGTRQYGSTYQVRTKYRIEYAHSVSEDRMAAQGEMLEAILRTSSEAVKQ